MKFAETHTLYDYLDTIKGELFYRSIVNGILGYVGSDSELGKGIIEAINRCDPVYQEKGR